MAAFVANIWLDGVSKLRPLEEVPLKRLHLGT